MMRRAVAVLLLGLLSAAAHADEADPRGIARQVRDVLARDDRGGIMSLPTASTPPADAWDYVKDLVERYDCIDVERVGEPSVSEEDGKATVRFELIATGVTIGAPRATESLPPEWVARLAKSDRGWMPLSVLSRESDAARLVISLPVEQRGAAIDAAVAGSESRDPLAFLRALTEEAPYDEPLLREVLRHAVARGEDDLEVHCIRQIATVNRGQPTAPALADEALAKAMTTEGAESTADAMFGAAVVYWLHGDIPGAVRMFFAAAELHRYLRDPRPALKCLYMGAHLQSLAGDARGALVNTERLGVLSATYGWAEGEALSAMHLGALFSTFGRPDASLASYRHAFALGDSLGLGELAAMAQFDIASSLAELGELEDAEAAFHDAAERAESQPAIRAAVRTAVRGAVGSLLVRAGKLREAEEHLLEAVWFAEHGQDAGTAFDAAISLGYLRLKQTDPAAALQQARAALGYARGINVYRTYHASWPAHLLAGRALRRLGCEEDALYELEEAVELIAAERSNVDGDVSASAEYFSARTAPFQELAALHLRAGRPEVAMRTAERMKARGVRDLLERGHIDPASFMTAAERQRYDELAKKEGELGRTALMKGDDPEVREALTKARLELRMFRMSVAISRAELRHRGYGDDVVLADLPSSLDDAAFVEFVAGDEETLVIAVAPKHNGRRAVTGRTIPIGREELSRRSVSLRKRIETRDLRYRTEARAMFELLLDPFEEVLGGASLIGILPDDSLWMLPFHVLRDRSGRHLVERAAVFYTPSLATLREPAAHARGTVLALGNPKLDSQTIARAKATFRDEYGSLPEAEAEVNGLKSIYGSDRVRVYIGEEARESVFKRAAPSAQIVHLAAHGKVDVRAPLFSAVLLTADGGQNGDDGLLEAREILDLPLRAELTVLAACETASGEIAGGEGMIGLAWALVAAGSSSVVASQWKTDSDAAAKTMLGFHRDFADGKTKAVALRNAQLARMRTLHHSHPFYWAPFVIYGMP